MADWLPGWTRHVFNLRGKPYQFTHNPKGCLHTTEGSSIAGALSAYAPYPPHGIYDWRTREKLQHIPLSLASYSAMDGNDDDYMIQIELVGRAAESRFWPDEAWRNIAEDVLKPIEDHFGVPRRALGFKDARDGITPYISSAQSPIRLGWSGLRDFSGWLGHQHLPAPDEHWDPGAIQINKAFSYMDAEEDDMLPEDKAQLTQVEAYAREVWEAAGKRNTANLSVLHQHVNFIVDSTQSTLNAVLGKLDDLAERIGQLESSGIPATIDYARLRDEVGDEIDGRARDNDPTTGPVS